MSRLTETKLRKAEKRMKKAKTTGKDGIDRWTSNGYGIVVEDPAQKPARKPAQKPAKKESGKKG